MGQKILNSSYQFTCSCAVTPTPFITASDTQTKGKEQLGGTILTNQAKCTPKVTPPCSKNIDPATKMPLPCVLTVTGHSLWRNTNTTMKIGGKPTLTPESKCICYGFGGTISTSLPSATSKVGKNTSAIGNVVLASGAAAAMVAGFVKPTVKATSQTTASMITIGALGGIANSQGGEESSEIGKEEVVATSLVENTSSTPEDRGYLICEYKTCGKWQDCDYYNATLEIKNSGTTLFNNYKQSDGTAYQAYFDKEKNGLELLAPQEFGHQAHHLIPGNQCYGHEIDGKLVFGELIRLGNFFGYNINHSKNCILLPGPKRKRNELDSSEHESQSNKNEWAENDVMGVMGCQWHSGPHSYTPRSATKEYMEHYFKENQGLGNRKDSTYLVSHYAELVWGKLEVLQKKKYSTNGKKKCQQKNYQEKKEKFISEMNKISQEIKEYLDRFSEDPKSSYPYFVSERTLAYAYDIPSTVKLIVLTTKDGVFMAHKIRLERDEDKKGGNGEFTFKKIKEGETHKLEQSASFVRFCGNVRYFVDTEKLRPLLPFFDKETDLCWKLPDKMEENETLTAFLIRQKEPLMKEIAKNEKSYEAPAAVARDRLEIMREVI